MRKIDRETVQKILDTAQIVDVVSDFVSLKKRGANYVGLCPFHNERTPSFSVSPSKGICKCFSCGKGGSAVGFLMELEQLSYSEALRYLAKKYGIEIKDREMTPEEHEAESERASLMTVSEYAMKYFERTLADTDPGRQIGLPYFRERGISHKMIERFHLGYSTDRRSDLYNTATSAGFNEKHLLATGLCYTTDNGEVRDRFRGRVIYPIFTVSGKVVAFGGRVLRTDGAKNIAKYVNSPETPVYSKSRELYGLYQSKQSIVRKDKCILVEGYMDVISMHQSGVENVVASSGTSLTEGQIRLIHRFTENVTVIYDSDPAGIKASLRGIDLLLAEGLNVKVVTLPDGDDPDSFAQSHTSDQVEQYLLDHEVDFITFKTRILLDDTGSDPIARSRAIQNIVRSIAVIPDSITRTVYIAECARVMDIDEQVLTLQTAKYRAENDEKKALERKREQNRRDAGLSPDPAADTANPDFVAPRRASDASAATAAPGAHAPFLLPYEKDLMRYAVRYGMCYLCDTMAEDDDTVGSMNVLEYIRHELDVDEITFADPLLSRLMDRCTELSTQWPEYLRTEEGALASLKSQLMEKGYEKIRSSAADGIGHIEQQERRLAEEVEKALATRREEMAEQYLQRLLLSDADDHVRRTATEMATSRHTLSKIHTKYSRIATERDRLAELVPLAVYNLKGAIIECEIRDTTARMAQLYATAPDDLASLHTLMQRNLELTEMKKQLAVYLGERILTPAHRR